MFVKCPNETNNCCPCDDSIPKILVQKCRYVGPPRPKQLKPDHNLQLSKEKFQDCTIYRGSYYTQLPPICRPKPYKENPNLTLSDEPFAKETINKLSYRSWNNLKPPKKCQVFDNLCIGGELHGITTQKQDYIPPLCYRRLKGAKQFENLCLGSGSFASETTTKLSYQPIAAKRPEQIKQKDKLKLFQGKMCNETVQQLSYLPLPSSTRPASTKRRKLAYYPPQAKIDCNSIYQMSYKTPGYYEPYWCYEPIGLYNICNSQ